MHLLLDSASLADIKRYLRSSSVRGVTTNPSLMAKESKMDYEEAIKSIAADLAHFRREFTTQGHCHLSVEVTTLDPKLMTEQAKRLASITGVSHVKIPVMVETLPVISQLAELGIPVNATACMTALQAKMADDAGAAIVSFFFNRMIDHNKTISLKDPRMPALQEIAQFREWSKTDVICGSIRGPADVADCWNAGAKYVTAGVKVLDQIIQHPKTVESIEGFQRDIDAWLA